MINHQYSEMEAETMKGQRNPIAKALRSSETNLRPKVVKDKTKYSRKTRHKPRDGSSHISLRFVGLLPQQSAA